MVSLEKRSNYRKYTSPNPLQRWLVGRFLDSLVRLVALSQCNSILDVGCGEGFVIEFLHCKMPQLSILGVDREREAIAFARARNHHTSFLCADALSLPLADHSFDLVLCLEVLEHVSQPWTVFDELVRVSARGLILSVPNQPLFSLANLLRGKNLRTLGEDPEHLHHWGGSEFVSLVNSKLSIARVAHPFPWVLVLGRVDSTLL